MRHWILPVILLLFGGCSSTSGGDAGVTLSFSEGNSFSLRNDGLGNPCSIESVAVPDGHTTSTVGHSKCTVWIKQPGVDNSVVVGLFATEHRITQEALAQDSTFGDLPAGDRVWRFRRNPDEDYDNEFMAILALSDHAIAIHGGLDWTDADIRDFLARVNVR